MAAVATIASCLAFLAPGVAYYSCSIQSHAIHPPTAPPLSLSETRMTVSNSCRDDDGEIGELLAAELARDDRTRTRTGGRWGGRKRGNLLRTAFNFISSRAAVARWEEEGGLPQIFGSDAICILRRDPPLSQ